MKKVLFITHNFPPAGGVGVIRIVKFAKFLPEFGLQPIILTSNGYTAIEDQSLLLDLPKNLEVHRVGYSDPAKIKIPLLRSIWMYFLSPFFCFPDGRSLWMKNAYKEALDIIKKEKIDLIFSSSGPVSNHVLAYKIKQATGVKWVADWRDEWVIRPDQNVFPTPFHKMLALKWEKKIIAAADHITTALPLLNDYFRKMTDKHKFTGITNGFDPADFSELSYQKTNEFKILHAGVLYGTGKNHVFSEAIQELNLSDLKVEFFGPGHYLAHAEITKKMQTADLLLIILSPVDRPAVISGKLFEYMAAKRPILCLSPESTATAKMVKNLKAGIVVAPQDKEGIKEAIKNYYEAWQKNELLPPQIDLTPFTRRHLTGKLADVFKEIV